MTREEAIMELNLLFVPAPIVPNKRWGCKRNEALSMAIEALQWQDRILTQIEDIVLKEHGERKDK